MSDDYFNPFDADNYSLHDFGIVKKGRFLANGGLDDWKFDGMLIGESLPRWLLREPVMLVTELGQVYLRGMFSEQLTRECRAAGGSW